MGLYDFAKCGLLENMAAMSIWLPLWQTGVVLLSVLSGQLIGILIGRHIVRRPLAIKPLRVKAIAVFVVLMTAALIAAAVKGLQYVFFILRIVKDGFYCTYFGASNSLTWHQAVALSIAIVGTALVSTLFVARGRTMLSPYGAACEFGSASSCAACVSYNGFTLIAGIAMFQAMLFCVTWRVPL